jgi:hypothetical protein
VLTAENERWAMDFVHDVLSGGRTIRVHTVVDVFSRECVALVAQPSFRGEDVARILTEAGESRGTLPTLTSVGNGTEFTSKALDHWANSRPGTHLTQLPDPATPLKRRQRPVFSQTPNGGIPYGTQRNADDPARAQEQERHTRRRPQSVARRQRRARRFLRHGRRDRRE